MESFYTILIFIGLIVIVALPTWWKAHKRQKEIARKHEAAVAAGLTEPATLHPRIDLSTCIGCGSCVEVCPEDVLGLVNGRAAVVSGMRCVGHALCADVCPVGAITMGFGKPRQGMELPYCDERLESNIPGLYIAGELGGLGLIRNAVTQGARAIDAIAQRRKPATEGIHDVIICGAGPAGLAAALAAVEHGLDYIVLEQGALGGSLLHYPRRKLVLTIPVKLPLHGMLKVSEISKEDLLGMFGSIAERYALKIQPNAKVDKIVPGDGRFVVSAAGKEYLACSVVLAIGRRGSPRKLGVPGEDLPKVAYQLIEAESYTGKHVLIVGGGDSAVEAAIGLSRQKGNTVTLSYRREGFVRLKEKNEKRVAEAMASGAISVLFNSEVAAIAPADVTLRQSGAPDWTVKNDFVFIFAGGELPAEFLKSIGVKLRTEEG